MVGFSMKRLVLRAILTAAALAAVGATAGPALADGKWYGVVRGGLAIANENELTFPNTGAITGDETYSYDLGLSGGGAIGYRLGKRMRIEAELAGTKVDADSRAVRMAPADGDTSALTFIVAGELDLADWDRFRPYLIGGLGVAMVDVSTRVPSDGVELVDDSGITFAYKLGAGFSFKLTDRSTATLSADYIGTTGVSVSGPTGQEVDSEFEVTRVLGGIRFAF